MGAQFQEEVEVVDSIGQMGMGWVPAEVVLMSRALKWV
jgi:hypothetical protein